MTPEDLGFPSVKLTHLPTPFEEAPRFARAIGGPRIFIKRDDMTSLSLGGNKARKLEFLLGEAVALGCDCVVTCGGPQSNHARMTAGAARKYGLDPVLVLDGHDPGYRQGNLLLDHILGSDIVFAGSESTGEVMDRVKKELIAKGRRPYVIPVGGSNPIGTLGYVACAQEIIEDIRAAGVTPRALYVPAGSCGTLAGLVLGKILFDAGFEVIGVAVSADSATKEERALDLVMQTASILKSRASHEIRKRLSRITPDVARAQVRVSGKQVGEGYGIPTGACLEAVELLARNEGIFTDPVYTAKALAGLVDDVRRGTYSSQEAVVFLHTGGVPANFAYNQAFVEGRKST